MNKETEQAATYKEYQKTATVKAKLFENGDEDGFVHEGGMLGVMEDTRYGLTPILVPYISTLENQFHRGEFGKHYICIGINNERWLVDKDIFEKTYSEFKAASQPTIQASDGWQTEKPVFTEDCILLTACSIKGNWEYNSWLIAKNGSDEGWYWGWYTIDCEEYGDIADLKADRYKVIKLINK